MSVKFNPYISFNGNCEQAFCFYKTVFGGEFSNLTRYGDVSRKPGEESVPEEIAYQIRYIELPIGNNLTLLGNDNSNTFSNTHKVGDNVKLCIAFKDKSEANRVFDALAVGGKVKLCFRESFLGSHYGVLIDKFGINWIITYNITKLHPIFEDNANIHIP